VSPGGVRAPVWIALAASGAILVAAVAATFEGAPGELAPPAGEARTPRLPERRPPVAAPARARRSAPVLAREKVETEPLVRSQPRAEEPAPEPPREDRRSPTLVGLEREAAALVEASGVVDPSAIAARVAELEPGLGESPADLERRREALRERLGSEALLLERRLGALFDTTVYPIGFPLEQTVVAQERQWIGTLPAADRETMLRNALEERELKRAEPQFEPPESGRYWQAEPPGM
jgi:hypothetical protein